MGSESSPKLPVIDFNKRKNPNNDNEWEGVKSQVHKALQDYGCFEALFDRVPLELLKSLFVVLKELFDLPLQTKQLNVSNTPFHGYVGQYPQVPLYESLGINDACISHKVETLEKTLWPQGNPSFSKSIQSFAEQVSELDEIVRKMILESLGVEKYMEEHMSSSSYTVRVMRYEGPQTEEAKLGITSHTDKNIITILHQLNEIQGLEVKTKDGEWITYHPLSPHSFVVMIGDAFHAWTNGRVYSTFHRVMMRGNEARYSVGLFSAPKEGHIVKTPEELVDEQHPLLFKPYNHQEFLKYFYTGLEAQTQKFGLKTFCGV
ncbi:putative 2-oxoglutarate-dependent dioxygenase AOP1 [Senna tora]|uniref:Putative 2-oxoglutarate-dependent dioxygenase AOP1 n=1 Tax=Senna tora TaxID=362788 RepID=A0A834XEW4_9FABA|nr:putative 2-oxoglutarate-dependent dioxygenase AOP1 [Senna tora]